MTVRISKKLLWKAIRTQCVECFGGNPQEVKFCTAPKCSLYPFRMGSAKSGRDKPPETGNSSVHSEETLQGGAISLKPVPDLWEYSKKKRKEVK